MDLELCEEVPIAAEGFLVHLASPTERVSPRKVIHTNTTVLTLLPDPKYAICNLDNICIYIYVLVYWIRSSKSLKGKPAGDAWPYR